MASRDITGQLARYMAGARQRKLPAEVAEAGRHRILDTLGAVVSGSRLKAGEMAIRYVRLQGGTPEASVLATDVKTSAVNAALAMAEREGSSGEELLRAVVLGYDVCCRS